MGTYCAIKIDTYDVLLSKSAVPDRFIELFDEGERRVIPVEDAEEPDVVYATTREIMLQRLDFLGFTKEQVRQAFEDWRQEALIVIAMYEDAPIYMSDERKLTEAFTFDDWRARAPWVFQHRYDANPQHGNDRFTMKMLDPDGDWFMWNTSDGRIVLRALLDEMPNVNLVTLDVAGLIQNQYVEDGPLVIDSRRRAAIAMRPLDSVVIVGEGTSDVSILQASLKGLFPAMASYFSFFDHKEFHVDGGTSFLVKFIRAFATARISTKLIAVFDNDAEGSQAFDEK